MERARRGDSGASAPGIWKRGFMRFVPGSMRTIASIADEGRSQNAHGRCPSSGGVVAGFFDARESSNQRRTSR